MKDTPLHSSPERMVPVETVVIDRRGKVLHASGEITGNGCCPDSPQGIDVAALFEGLLLPENYREFLTLLNDPAADRFSRNYLTATLPTRTVVICGSPYPPNPQTRGWLLTIQDVSACRAMGNKLVVLEKEMQAILLSQAEELEEATMSLIETNVALRREIRDRQSVLEALRESEARFRNLTETTGDFIWEIDAGGLYTYASPKSEKLLGLLPGQLVGTLFLPWRAATPTDGSGEPEAAESRPAGGFYLEYSYLREDGREVIVESRGEPILSPRGDIAGFCGIDRDITERRVYEIDLRRAKELAESANHAKSEFLANMSHELRTPLHAILSFAGFGEKKIESAARRDLLHFFQQISNSANRLIPLINGLLDLAQLEAGRMNYSFGNNDLGREIAMAIDELGPLAEKKGLEIHIESPVYATGAFFDPVRIGQVVRNILSNAIKFSDSGTAISITFSRQQQLPGRDMLCTTVSNRGIGIPAEDLTAIFEKFTQSSRTRSGAGGTGLGLAICRQIVEDHRGEIWADTGPDGTTRFHFTLPISSRAANKGIISSTARESEQCRTAS